ncbi:uncharacterized protein LOC125670776 isoform X2 [Ostrea edulis]|nr:uncharacterized protein LOC125670776 isoform X2 [Ostrea edulis]XP_056019586.1 uncharacterized protein LOC125670776 isoform X2 [Ostrea edulis]XP_056019587.1 uncharacterized protein LOC125670776 isoform X2 [Ostrea edulis]XP_056019588.1 uncharacterized protein LOC125670776 isoform X2 [Ostrea edulis]
MCDTDGVYDTEIFEADPVFKKACEEINEKGFSPTLIKDVLKSKIQLRRVSIGQEELRVEKRPYVKHPLTPDEQYRNEARKKCNRVSAKKCRQKKKQQYEQIFDKLKDQEQTNEDLKRQVSEMESEKAKMLKILGETYSHICGQTITPENVMDVVRLDIQNDPDVSHLQSDHNAPNIQNIKPPTDQCHAVISPNTSNFCPSSEEITFPVTSDFTTQTKDIFAVQQLVNLGAEIPEGPNIENYLTCVSEENVSDCSNEWNEFFAAEIQYGS